MLGIIVRPVFFCSKILVMSKKMKNFKTGMSKTTETLCFTSKKKIYIAKFKTYQTFHPYIS